MIDDQFLFYAWTQNSQLLFSEPGIRPFFWRFWRALGLQKVALDQMLMFDGPLQVFLLWKKTQIPNSYLTNLESGPFLRILLDP